MVMVKQARDEDVTAYYKRFKDLVENMELLCRKLQPIVLAEMDLKYAKAAEVTKEKMIDREQRKVLTCLLVRGVKSGFYSSPVRLSLIHI